MWVLGLIEKTRSTVAGQYRDVTGFPHEAIYMWSSAYTIVGDLDFYG